MAYTRLNGPAFCRVRSAQFRFGWAVFRRWLNRAVRIADGFCSQVAREVVDAAVDEDKLVENDAWRVLA